MAALVLLLLMSYRIKFSTRARVWVFVGYPPTAKGYKLYDIVFKSFFVSRDELFHESLFPFHSISNACDISDLFSTQFYLYQPLFLAFHGQPLLFLFHLSAYLFTAPFLNYVVPLGLLNHLLIFVIIIIIFFMVVPYLFLVTILCKIIRLILNFP